MRHRISQKKLKGPKAAREKVLRNLAGAVILYEKIETTKSKAKLVRPLVEKSMKARYSSEVTERRRLSRIFFDKNIINKIFDLRKYYKDKTYGFLRIVSVGYRRGDGAEKVILQLILPEKLKEETKKSEMSKPKVTVTEKMAEEKLSPSPASKKRPVSHPVAKEKPGQRKEGWLDRVSKKGPLSTFKKMAKKITSRRTTSK